MFQCFDIFIYREAILKHIASLIYHSYTLLVNKYRLRIKPRLKKLKKSIVIAGARRTDKVETDSHQEDNEQQRVKTQLNACH